jgi:hypothetical protein
MLKKILMAIGLVKRPKTTTKAIIAAQALRYGRFGLPALMGGALLWRMIDKRRKHPQRRRAVSSPY